MSKKTETITPCKQQSESTEHKCQYQTLLKECAELLLDMQREYAALHYSIYQDDEPAPAPLKKQKIQLNQGLLYLELLHYTALYWFECSNFAADFEG